MGGFILSWFIIALITIISPSESHATKRQLVHKEIRRLHNKVISCENAQINESKITELKELKEVLESKQFTQQASSNLDTEADEFQEKLKRATCAIQTELGDEPPGKSVEDLLLYIESHKRDCKLGDKTLTFNFKKENGSLPVQVSVIHPSKPSSAKDPCHVFVSFGRELGRGGFHKVFHAFSSKSWKGLARAVLLYPTSKTAVEDQVREMKSLELLETLMPHPGIVKVYKASEQGIFMEQYDKDLFVAVNGDKRKGIAPVEYTYAQKLKILSQLSLALAKIHENFISHNDIKLENVLVKAPDTAVYSDFELATNISQRFQSKGKPAASGNQDTAAPEVGQGWLGDSDKEKMENAMKADVFSHGLVAYQLFFDRNFMDLWRYNRECMGGDFTHFQQCKAKLIEEFIKKETNDLAGSQGPLRKLLLDAIQPQYKKRITSKEFLRRLNDILDPRTRAKTL